MFRSVPRPSSIHRCFTNARRFPLIRQKTCQLISTLLSAGIFIFDGIEGDLMIGIMPNSQDIPVLNTGFSF